MLSGTVSESVTKHVAKLEGVEAKCADWLDLLTRNVTGGSRCAALRQRVDSTAWGYHPKSSRISLSLRPGATEGTTRGWCTGLQGPSTTPRATRPVLCYRPPGWDPNGCALVPGDPPSGRRPDVYDPSQTGGDPHPNRMVVPSRRVESPHSRHAVHRRRTPRLVRDPLPAGARWHGRGVPRSRQRSRS